VTLKVRNLVYVSILNKHIGWFDNRDNSPSVISATLAKDTSIVNGVSTESISPSLEGGMAFVIGLCIGFYYSWEMSVAMFLVSPIMAVGAALEMKYMAGGDNEKDSEGLWKEANLLSGDAIINYKTV